MSPASSIVVPSIFAIQLVNDAQFFISMWVMLFPKLVISPLARM